MYSAVPTFYFLRRIILSGLEYFTGRVVIFDDSRLLLSNVLLFGALLLQFQFGMSMLIQAGIVWAVLLILLLKYVFDKKTLPRISLCISSTSIPTSFHILTNSQHTIPNVFTASLTAIFHNITYCGLLYRATELVQCNKSASASRDYCLAWREGPGGLPGRYLHV